MSSNFGGRANKQNDATMQYMRTAAELDRAMNSRQVPGGFVREGIAIDLRGLIEPKVENLPPVDDRPQPLGIAPIQVENLPEAPPFRPQKSVLKR